MHVLNERMQGIHCKYVYLVMLLMLRASQLLVSFGGPSSVPVQYSHAVTTQSVGSILFFFFNGVMNIQARQVWRMQHSFRNCMTVPEKG